MLIPKRTKYRKRHRISYEGKAKENTTTPFLITLMNQKWKKPRKKPRKKSRKNMRKNM